MSISQNSPAGDVAIRDEALDPLTGDVYLNGTDGDQVMLAGVEGIASDVKAAWAQVKGEWYLDLNEGVDYYGLVFVKNPNLGDIRDEFVRVALGRPGVVAVPKFEPTIDLSTRTLSASYEIEADTGEVFGETDAVISAGAA